MLNSNILTWGIMDPIIESYLITFINQVNDKWTVKKLKQELFYYCWEWDLGWNEEIVNYVLQRV